MAQNTTRLALTYPQLSDPADVPFYMQQLAEQLDITAVWLTGTLAARPAATSKGGRLYRVSSGAGLGDIYLEAATSWIKIYTPQPKLNALSMLNGWSVFDGAIAPSYSDVLPNGEVVLSGLALWAGASPPNVDISNAAPMFNIAAGSRPARQCGFQVGIGNSAYSTYGTGMVECMTNGDVHLRAVIMFMSGVADSPGGSPLLNWSNTFVYLDPIRFFHTYV